MPKLQQPHGRRGEAMMERVDWAAVALAEAALALAWEANSLRGGRG